MTSIEQDDGPRLTPDGEDSLPAQSEGGGRISDPMQRASIQSLPEPATWTTVTAAAEESWIQQSLTTSVTAAAEESWIQQSLAMPSTTNGTPLAAQGNDSNISRTTGRSESNISTSVPPRHRGHRREGSLEQMEWAAHASAVSENIPRHRRERSLEKMEWAAHASALSDQMNMNGDDTATAGISGAPPIRDTSVASWGSNSFGNGDSCLDPMTFTTSYSSNEDDTSGIPSDIHDAARIFNWPSVLQLCGTKPEAAAYIGEDGWTALHHACNRRCPDPNVMEALIRAYPDALLITEDKEWTPLHYACRFKAPRDVVYLLLYMYPEKGRVAVSRPDRRGRMPLYYAVRYSAPPGVVELLIQMEASAVLEEDQNADSPLALIWDDWAEKLDGKKDILKILVGEEESSRSSDILMTSIGNICFDMNNSSKIEDRIEDAKIVRKRLERMDHVLARWNKVNTFLKAAFGFPSNEGCNDETRPREEEKKDTQEEATWRILHAISAIKCHSSLFLLASALHPEQAFELDRNDLRGIDNIYKSEDCNKSNPSNLTALHLAASSHSSGDSGKMVITQLLALNETAAECVDTEESTPLHRISGNKYKKDWTLDAVEDVYAYNRNAISKIDANGRLPLHRASSAITYYDNNLDDANVTSRSKICRLLHEHVDAASHRDNFGCLPLHLVAQYGKSWDVQVQSLYEGNPSAVRVRTGVKLWNRLPLHLAAANVNSDVSMIKNLIKYNPLGASQADRKGFLPLHVACESGQSWEIVRLIHQAFPAAVEQAEQNKRGWNALHMAAASKNSDGELLSELVKLFPSAATFCDSDDRYPLHLACMSGHLWDDGLSCLFGANASAIRCRDEDGLLPLHIVAFRNCSKPPIPCENIPKITNKSSRRSKSLMALERDQLDKKEKREAQELSNIFEILRSDPTALLV